MMKLEYIETDPTKNITLLVTTPVPEALQAAAAEELMAQMPECEQVGFVSRSDGVVRLRMMGGEFCGNASLSLAAALAGERGRGGEFLLSVSGTDGPVRVFVEDAGEGAYTGSVSMPLPREIRTCGFGRMSAPVVFFPGIAHAVVRDRIPVPLAEMLIREWSADLGAGAFGIMLLDEPAGRLTPVVYVRSTDTVVRESSCASGTAACAALEASVRGNAEMRLTEPGGIMAARASAVNGKVTELELTAGVILRRRGSAVLSQKFTDYT